MEIERLFADEAFKEEIINAETIEDLGTILKSHGLEIEDSVLASAFADSQEGELDESSLESVAGGSWLSSLRNYINALRYKAGGGGFSSGGGGGHAFGGGGGGGGR